MPEALPIPQVLLVPDRSRLADQFTYLLVDVRRDPHLEIVDPVIGRNELDAMHSRRLLAALEPELQAEAIFENPRSRETYARHEPDPRLARDEDDGALCFHRGSEGIEELPSMRAVLEVGFERQADARMGMIPLDEEVPAVGTRPEGSHRSLPPAPINVPGPVRLSGNGS
jgi:hypothetical protein